MSRARDALRVQEARRVHDARDTHPGPVRVSGGTRLGSRDCSRDMPPSGARLRSTSLALAALVTLGCAGAGRDGHGPSVAPERLDTTPAVPASARPYRPFADDSPWNTPIAADAPVRPDSAALIQHLARSSRWPGLSVSIHPWSVPVYTVDSRTPRVAVHTSLSNEGEHPTLRWPVPTDAQPAPESDGHLALVDRAAGRAYDFFQARRRSDGGWDCTLCATVDLGGSGVRPPKGGPAPWYASHGSRACGFPLVAGLVTPDELRAGEIRHALVLAYPGVRQRWFVSPASTGHPANGRISEHTGIPCGGRVQLDPRLDVDALGLSPGARVIARAIQVYGAYVGDYSDSINVYADGSEAARGAYAGVLASGDTAGIDLAHLRVLEWGRLTPDG
ncbi:MAG: hypothetical protein H6726_01645 [Sandaracinaceae bacterium]|nr:hypothetical protein [Myxococcales bacterium]MCB9656324.1 hypothetical protein [Sandaracinaceae bacterium]